MVLALCLLPWVIATSTAQSAVAPPCGTLAKPGYAPPGDDPNLLIVTKGRSVERWAPPTCTGWKADGFQMLLALAGSFRFEGTGDTLLMRFGRISSLRGIKYWSEKGGGWSPLIKDAAALRRADPGSRRPDFTLPELRTGHPLYFFQDDNRSSGPVVYRMQVLQSDSDRLVVTVENVSPIRAFFITWFPPRNLQSIYIFERREAGIWTLYTLWRTGAGVNAPSAGHEKSYASRALAFYRYLAGIPTDLSPPVLEASR
jgi:hypothetical protein